MCGQSRRYKGIKCWAHVSMSIRVTQQRRSRPVVSFFYSAFVSVQEKYPMRIVPLYSWFCSTAESVFCPQAYVSIVMDPSHQDKFSIGGELIFDFSSLKDRIT